MDVKKKKRVVKKAKRTASVGSYKVVSYSGKRQRTSYHKDDRSAYSSAKGVSHGTNTTFKKTKKGWKGVMSFSHKKMNGQLN